MPTGTWSSSSVPSTTSHLYIRTAIVMERSFWFIRVERTSPAQSNGPRLFARRGGNRDRSEDRSRLGILNSWLTYRRRRSNAKPPRASSERVAGSGTTSTYTFQLSGSPPARFVS